MARRPNFLLFITDQHRADHLGCYGNCELPTPHIDALAARGWRFDDFHVATPICQPNRASLMTGRLPSVHGLQMNGRELSLGEQTFVEILREAGWRTALVGKSHLQNNTTAPTAWPGPGQRLPHDAVRAYPGVHGQEIWKRWEDDPGFELALPYYGFGQVVLTIGHGDRQHGHWRRWLRQQTTDADKLLGPENAIPTPGLALAKLGQAWRTRVPEEWYPTRYIADQTCGVLDQVARGDTPFFIQCSFPDPHHPFTPPGRFWDLVQPEAVTLPASFHAQLVDPPPAIPWLRAQRKGNAAFRPGYGSFACSEQEAREAIALNHGSLANVDDAIGRVMAHLRALGLDDDTVVMFTSDHGDLLGDRGLMFKGGLHYPALTRVPFIWHDPRQAPLQASSSALAQTIDIAPTVLARAGLPPANGMQGRSLLPVLEGVVPRVRERLLIEEESQRSDFGMDRRLRMRTLRDRQYRLSIYDGQTWGELYDLEQDPHELCNLWNDRASLALRRDLTEQLARAMLDAADTSPYPDFSA